MSGPVFGVLIVIAIVMIAVFLVARFGRS